MAVKVIKLPQRKPRTCPFLLSPSREMIPHHHHRSINVPVRNHLVDPSMFLPVNVSCQPWTYRPPPGIAGTDGNRTKKKDDALRGKVDDVVKVRTKPTQTPSPKPFSNGRSLSTFRLSTCVFIFAACNPDAAFKLK